MLSIAGYSNFNHSQKWAGNCRATLNDVTSENKASTERLIYFDKKEGKNDEKQKNTWWPRPSLKATCLQPYLTCKAFRMTMTHHSKPNKHLRIYHTVTALKHPRFNTKVKDTKGTGNSSEVIFYLGVVSGTLFSKSDKEQLQIGVPQ